MTTENVRARDALIKLKGIVAIGLVVGGLGLTDSILTQSTEEESTFPRLPVIEPYEDRDNLGSYFSPPRYKTLFLSYPALDQVHRNDGQEPIESNRNPIEPINPGIEKTYLPLVVYESGREILSNVVDWSFTGGVYQLGRVEQNIL